MMAYLYGKLGTGLKRCNSSAIDLKYKSTFMFRFIWLSQAGKGRQVSEQQTKERVRIKDRIKMRVFEFPVAMNDSGEQIEGRAGRK